MAPLAVVARHLGAEVTGCDRAGRPDIHAYLAREGIWSQGPHSADHVRPGTTLVATAAASAAEPEIVAADVAGGRWHRTDLLATVLRTRRALGITGSHGKGTVTALATAALAASGRDPLALVGVPVDDFDGLTRLGGGPIVAEVDNSDLSLVSVDTDVAVVTNLDHDHPTLGISLREVVDGVGAFVGRARHRVILGPSPRAAALAEHASAPVWRYGTDFSARVVRERAGVTVVDLAGPLGARERAELRLLTPRAGVNAALAFASALAMGAEPAAAAAGLGDVSSLPRRLGYVGIRDGVRVFDDCGNKHPVSLREGLLALRRHFPDARLTAVLEPYGPFLATWGRRFARTLPLADHVVVLPPAYREGRDSAGRSTPGGSRHPDWTRSSPRPTRTPPRSRWVWPGRATWSRSSHSPMPRSRWRAWPSKGPPDEDPDDQQRPGPTGGSESYFETVASGPASARS